MKKHFLFGIYLFAFLKCLPQDSLKILRIDSIVVSNENKVSTVFQKIEKNRIEAMHGKNPNKTSNVYRFIDKNTLISATFIAYSIGDTEMVINLYFDSGILIKAKTISFDLNNKRSEYNYYYKNNQLINKDIELSGIHGANYYVDWAIRLRKNLKKKPIKFRS